jgi:hypothetical protein
MSHPESDCLFEVFTKKDYLDALGDGCIADVTGLPEYEEAFNQQRKP